MSSPSPYPGASRESFESVIKKLVKEHGSPLMLIQRKVLQKQYKNFKYYLKTVDPFYAVKSNPHPEIIRTFAELDCGFDCASAREIDWVLSAGVNPRQILFAHTIKSIPDLKYAYEKNVRWMTFDNEPELYKIAKNCPGARVVLRIKVPNIGSVVELSLKFGADPEHALFLLKKARQLGLSPDGVSFHVGSQCTNPGNYLQALEVSSQIFDKAKKEGINLKTLDIGGGFPIKHFEHEEMLQFEKLAGMLKKEIRRLFEKNIRIIAEPGRFFCGPSGILVTQVVGRSYRDNKNYYYLNDGVYQDFSGIIFDHCKYEFKAIKRGPKYLSTIAGPTCDSLDVLSLSEELPELDYGHIVYVKNIGAYSSASAVPAFNGFSPAKILII